jgi:hypothetical protein
MIVCVVSSVFLLVLGDDKVVSRFSELILFGYFLRSIKNAILVFLEQISGGAKRL